MLKLILLSNIIYLKSDSWKPECVLSFNMGWRILVLCQPILKSTHILASMNYVDSDMSNCANKVVYFD